MKSFLNLIFAFVFLFLWANSGWAQGTMTFPDCSGQAAVSSPMCEWLLAKMDGRFYTGSQTQEGSWSYRYDDYGNPIYIAQKTPNVTFPKGVPASTGFSIFQALDKPLINQLFEIPDPNKPGAFLKTSLEVVEYYPPGDPNVGKMKRKIGLIIDGTSLQAGGLPHLMIVYEEHTYPTANQTKIERMLLSINSATPGPLIEAWEYWDRDNDGRLTKIVKMEEIQGKYRIDKMDFFHRSSPPNAGRISSIVHKWSDCSLNSAHCVTSASNPELVGNESQHRIETIASITTLEGHLDGMTFKEYHGDPAGALADNTVDKEVSCTIGRLQGNQIPIFGLPKILKELGFAATEVPTGMHCQTNIPTGSTETYDATFTWAPRWRFGI